MRIHEFSSGRRIPVRVPRAEQVAARSYDDLVILGMKYGQEQEVASSWARCVLRGREIAEQVRRERIISANRRRDRAKELRG